MNLCAPVVYLRRGPAWQWCLLAMVASGAVRSGAQQVATERAQANIPAGQTSPADNAPTVLVMGSVADPSGALIPGAILLFKPLKDSAEADAGAGTGKDAVTDAAGRFSVALAPGNYTLNVNAEGFTDLSRQVVVGLRPSPLTLHMAIATTSEQVDVPVGNAASTANADNKSALVFKGDQLDTLASDDTLLQQEVSAMSGAGGTGGGSVYVNGFSGGQFPPKDTIREIRINQNPYSAQYPELGYGRVEIFTKPGGDKLHGDYFSAGTTRAFNSLNPYTGEEPPYFLLFNRGDLNGPLGKKTSFFLSGRRVDQHNNAVVNAFNPDGSPLSEAVPSPDTNYNLSGRIDRQVSKNNTFIGRYEYTNDVASNSGVGLLVLPSEGTTNSTTTQTLQLSNTELIGANIVSETRFQYLRTGATQTPNSSSPTVVVEGAFNGGGAPSQNLRDAQDQFEFQEYLSVVRGDHFLRLGARYILLKEMNTSTANYNGSYTFTDLQAYQAGTPNLFSLTAGQPTASLLTGTLGAYAEDEWKARKNVTLTYGLRLESQSAVPDHLDPAPRAGFNWAVRPTDKHGPAVVLRGGVGVFYSRFAATDLLTSIRQNGTSQQAYYITNPTFYPQIPGTGQLTGVTPTPYTVNPNLRIASENIASLAVERSLGKFGQIAATYYAVRGVHQYNSANINAPLANGTRPMGGDGDVYQFQSAGVEKAQSLVVNTNLQLGKRGSFFGSYTARRQNNDTFGSTSFPSQPFDVSADYGPSGLGMQPIGQRLFAGGDVKLPFGLGLEVFTAAFSRTRFNITTGTDRNADTQFNDRPAFATAPGASSLLYRTAYGTFDANPQAGEAIIPYNYGVGPRLAFVGTELGREFHFGPRGEAPKPPLDSVPKPGQAPAKGELKYTWRIALDAENLTNTNNAGAPVGVLASPLFGRSISTNSSFGWVSAANRVLLLTTSFRF